MLRKPEQAAIEAIAKQVTATWKPGDGRPDAYLSIAGKRVAVDVTSCKNKSGDAADVPRPRLRFDRVAIGLVSRLQAALSDAVPDGRAVLVTVTAPIRLPGKTAVAFEDKIRTCLTRRSATVECKDTICGNHVRIRIVTCAARHVPKVIGLVHNAETDADLVLGMTQALLECVSGAGAKPAPARFTGERWLVIANANGPAHIDTYRQIYTQLGMASVYKKVFMVLGEGRVETVSA